MNETVKIAAIVLTPFLVGGAFLYFARRNRKLQFYVLMPILLALTLRAGFTNDWRTRDCIDLGLVFCLVIFGWLSLFRQQETKKRDDDITA
jgi:hypothetical protein